MSVGLTTLAIGIAAFWVAFKARKSGADFLVLLVVGVKFGGFGLFRLIAPSLPGLADGKFASFLFTVLAFLLLIPNWLLMIALIWRSIKSPNEKIFKTFFLGLAAVLLILSFLPYLMAIGVS